MQLDRLAQKAQNAQCKKSSQRETRYPGATVAFYASISQYEKYFAAHGFGEAARRAASAAQQHDYSAMLSAIPDDMVDTFAIVGTPEEVQSKLIEVCELADSITVIAPTNFLTPDQILSYQRAITSTLYQ